MQAKESAGAHMRATCADELSSLWAAEMPPVSEAVFCGSPGVRERGNMRQLWQGDQYSRATDSANRCLMMPLLIVTQTGGSDMAAVRGATTRGTRCAAAWGECVPFFHPWLRVRAAFTKGLSMQLG